MNEWSMSCLMDIQCSLGVQILFCVFVATLFTVGFVIEAAREKRWFSLVCLLFAFVAMARVGFYAGRDYGLWG